MTNFQKLLEKTRKIVESSPQGGLEIQSFKNAGLMTNDVGLVVTLGSGEKFNITVQKDLRHGKEGSIPERDFADRLMELLEENEAEFYEFYDDEDEEDDDAEYLRWTHEL